MPGEFIVGEFYWWKVAPDLRVLVRLIQDGGTYLSVRISSATPEQVLRIKHGCGELTHLDKRSAPLEKV